MSNPKCGACGKTVYPMELMTAANKSWHKFCFKCNKCKSTLNLKNFKAFDGHLWCAVHYPPAQSKITSFQNDKQADSGTFENEASQSATDAGGAWGGGQADAGECALAAARRCRSPFSRSLRRPQTQTSRAPTRARTRAARRPAAATTRARTRRRATARPRRRATPVRVAARALPADKRKARRREVGHLRNLALRTRMVFS